MTILLSFDGTTGMWSARRIGDESNFRAESDSFHEAIVNLETHFDQREKRKLLSSLPVSNSVVKVSEKQEPDAKLIELTM